MRTLTLWQIRTHTVAKFKNTAELKSVKLLGLYLDTRLTWHDHILSLCKKLARVWYLLRRLKQCVNFEMLITAYHAFFQPHLLYGIMLWGDSSYSNKVFIWQKKAIRLIAGIGPRESCKPYFKIYGILTLPALYILVNIMHVKENFSTFTVRSSVHNYNTRKKNDIDKPSHHLSANINSHCYQQIIFFNKIPSAIRNLEKKKFQSVLSDWFKREPFYTVEEFLSSEILEGAFK